MKITCKVNRIDINRIEVNGTTQATPIVKLVPTDAIGDFYFAVPGGEVTFNADDDVIEAKNAQGFVIDRKVIAEKGTRALSVKTPEGAVFTVGTPVTIDLTPVAS